MTDDDKALVERLTAAIKESIGKQFNATPIHPDPNVGDWAASGGVIDLKQVAQSLLPIISDRIEALSAENERLREALGWFLNDSRFVVQVGGNPNVVPQMIEAARAALGETK